MQFPVALPVIFIFVLPQIQSSEDDVDFEGSCVQCVAGDFLSKKYLLQNSEQGISMVWMNDWSYLNCDRGKNRTVKCKSACIRITLDRLYEGSAGYLYNSLMMDCADDLIYVNPDLPPGIDYTKFMKNATYIAFRMGYRLKYEFTMQPIVNQTQLLGELAELKAPGTQKGLSTIAITMYSLIAGTLLLVVSASLFLLCCPDCHLLRCHRGKNATSSENLELEEAFVFPERGAHENERRMSAAERNLKTRSL